MAAVQQQPAHVVPMADKSEDHPLWAARPPTTDPADYLALVRYHLSDETTPVLHQVLVNDDALAAHIGWDLVMPLLDHLPASEQCLRLVAAKGNPRETLLSVAEALRSLHWAGDAPDSESDDDEDERAAENTRPSQARETKTARAARARSSTAPSAAPSAARNLPLPVLQFDALLSMLPTLHRRLGTRRPSRFLVTSLRAVLAAFSGATEHVDVLTAAAVKAVKTLSGTKRPHLPPRVSTGSSLTAQATAPEHESDFKTEAADTSSPSADEAALSNKLLQAFVTRITEDYVDSWTSDSDVPGLAWCSRLAEKLQPDRVLPGKPTYASRFETEDDLRARTAMLGQLVAVAQDLGLASEDFYYALIGSNDNASWRANEEQECEPPSSVDEIPLSRAGALVLFAARKVSEVLYHTSAIEQSTPPVTIFPMHKDVVQNFFGDASSLDIDSMASLEHDALLDAVLCLGLIAIEEKRVHPPDDYDRFASYLHTVSLISAHTPSPSLRYHAHRLCAAVLHSHPDDVARLSFIRDTLEHCPYPALKGSAVSWLKAEILDANQAPSPTGSEETSDAAASSAGPSPRTAAHDTSIFATPVVLHAVSHSVLPDVRATLKAPTDEAWAAFKAELSFYLAALNFGCFLCALPPELAGALGVRALLAPSAVRDAWVEPMRAALGVFRTTLENGGLHETLAGAADYRADLALLAHDLDRFEAGLCSVQAA